MFSKISLAFLKQTCEKKEVGLEALCVEGSGEEVRERPLGEGRVKDESLEN